MSRVAICLAAFLAFVSSASAQIFYEPVQYQYRTDCGVTYYYGGSDPLIHAIAGVRLDGHRVISDQPERVYTDATGVIDARLLGYTIADARNEAYANVPRYFAKRDLLASAVRHDGVWVVPVTAPTVHVYKSNGMQVDQHPATMPKPLLIIPKDMLDKPLLPHPSDKPTVAMN